MGSLALFNGNNWEVLETAGWARLGEVTGYLLLKDVPN
jgi:hypothetical protein